MADNEVNAVPAGQQGGWTAFLKSIASVSGDLSSLTAPPFILSPVSLTEFPAYWCERPELFSAIADAETDEERSLAVLKWFISTLKGQYTSRNEKMGSEKKPLNPVLGELFYGQWPSVPPAPSPTNPLSAPRGQTTLVVEQVSHHPPITAYFIENKEKGIKLNGNNAQKTSFSGTSITVKQIGHAIMTVAPSTGPFAGKTEQFLITLPKLRIDGVLYGLPYVELTETSYIQSSSGWLSTIEYKGKGYFGGKSHQFKATVTSRQSSSIKHILQGDWTTTSTWATPPPAYLLKAPSLTLASFGGSTAPSSYSTPYGTPSLAPSVPSSLASSSTSSGTSYLSSLSWGSKSPVVPPGKNKSTDSVNTVGSASGGNGGIGKIFTDVTCAKEEVSVKDIDEQGEWESRKLWKLVAKGIREKDYDLASRDKTRIENEQRQRRRDEAAAGTSWQLKHFDYVEEDPIYAKLGGLFSAVPPKEDAYVYKGNGPFDA